MLPKMYTIFEVDFQWFVGRACFFKFPYNLITPTIAGTIEMPINKDHHLMLKLELVENRIFTSCQEITPQITY